MFAHTQSFVDFLKRLIMSAGVANTTKIPAHVDLSQPHTWVNCGLCLRSLSKCELGEIISFLELSNCKILNAQFQTGAYPSWSGPSMGDSGSGPQNPSRFRSVVVITLASHARSRSWVRNPAETMRMVLPFGEHFAWHRYLEMLSKTQPMNCAYDFSRLDHDINVNPCEWGIARRESKWRPRAPLDVSQKPLPSTTQVATQLNHVFWCLHLTSVSHFKDNMTGSLPWLLY